MLWGSGNRFQIKHWKCPSDISLPGVEQTAGQETETIPAFWVSSALLRKSTAVYKAAWGYFEPVDRSCLGRGVARVAWMVLDEVSGLKDGVPSFSWRKKSSISIEFLEFECGSCRACGGGPVKLKVCTVPASCL
jgi:hypothetical protein